MSDHPGSDQDSLSSWTLVSQQGMVESDSSSSSDFVKVNQQGVSYHKHRDDTDSDIDSLENEEQAEGYDLQGENIGTSGEIHDLEDNGQLSESSKIEGPASSEKPLDENLQVSVSDQILLDTNFQESLPDLELTETVVTDGTPPLTDSEEHVSDQATPETASQRLVEDRVPSATPSLGSDYELLFPIKSTNFEEEEHGSCDHEKNRDDFAADVDRRSETPPKENDMAPKDKEHVAEVAEEILHRPHSSKEADAVIELLKMKLMVASQGPVRGRSSTCASDSDASDFVRIDPVTAAMDDQQQPQQQMHTSGSSVASNFSFFNPRWWESMERREVRHQDEEFEPLPGVDDRCESDISASEGSDVSGMDIVPVINANTIRQYRHRPNNDLNSILNLVMLAVVTAAVGLGIGHSIGSARESYLQNQLRENQVERMKDLQDDLIGCWNKNEALDDHIAELSSDNSMMKEETELWKTKYRDTLVSIDDLQDRIRDLESARKQHEQRLREEKTTWKTEFKELTSDKLELQRQVQEADQNKQQLTSLAEENVRLKADFQDLQEKLKKTVQTFDSFKQQSVSEIQKKAYQEKIASLQTKMHQLEANQKKNQKEYETLEVRYESTLRELDYRQSIDRVKDRNLVDYQAEISTLTSNLKDLEFNHEATKSEYEALMSEYQSTNQKVQHFKEAENKARNLVENYKNQITILAQQLQDLEDKQKEKEQQTGIKVKNEIQPLRNRINILQTENEGLTMQLGMLKYTHHPGNSESMPGEEIENEEDQAQEMDEDPLVEALKIKLDEITAKQFAAKSRAAMWREFYLQEKELRERAEQDSTSDNNLNQNSSTDSAGLFTCVSIIMSHLRVNWSDPVIQNLTSTFGEKLYMAQNITSESVKDAWGQIEKFTESEEFQGYVKTAKTSYKELKEMLKQKFEELNVYVQSDEFSAMVNETKESLTDFTENVMQRVSDLTDSVTLRSYVNKSKETVASVTERLHITWEQLRNMSSHLIQKHQPTYDRVKTNVKDNIEIVTDVINKFWNQKHSRKEKKEKEKHNKGNGRSNVEKKQNKHKKGKRKFDADRQMDHEETVSSRKKGHNEKQEKWNKRRENKPNGHKRKWHHEKAGKPHCHDKHCHRTHDRKRGPKERKTQLHLKELQNFIRKMNHKKVRRMDKDDIKGILKKLERLHENVQKHHRDGAKTWLACQLHWWKAYARGNLDADKIDNCKRILSEWQLHYSCRKGFCQYNDLKERVVVLINEKRTEPEMNASFDDKKTAAKNSFMMRDDPTGVKSGKKEEEYNSTTWEGSNSKTDWYFKSMRKETDSDSQWYLHRMEDREDQRQDSEWWFNLGHGREYHRHPTGWIFERAQWREDERDRPNQWQNKQDRMFKEEKGSNSYFEPRCGLGKGWCDEKWEEDWDFGWG